MSNIEKIGSSSVVYGKIDNKLNKQTFDLRVCWC